MLTPSNRPRGDRNLDTRMGRTDDNVDLLSRRIVAMERPDSAAAGTGAVTGVTRLTAGSLIQSNAASPVGSSVTFADYTIARLFGRTDVDISESATAGRLEIATPGFYEFRAHVRMAFNGSTLSEVRVSADWQGADPYPLWYHRLGSADGQGGGGPSLRYSFPWGPIEIPEGGSWTFFGLNWMSADKGFLSAMAVDVWKVG